MLSWCNWLQLPLCLDKPANSTRQALKTHFQTWMLKMQNGATINFSYCGITAIKLEEKYSFRTPTYLKFCQGSGWSLSSPNLTNSNFSIEISTISSFHDATSFLFWQASKLATLAHWKHLLKNFTIISIWYTVGLTPKSLDSYSSLPHSRVSIFTVQI